MVGVREAVAGIEPIGVIHMAAVRILEIGRFRHRRSHPLPPSRPA